jgi:hypothetical protein
LARSTSRCGSSFTIEMIWQEGKSGNGLSDQLP